MLARTRQFEITRTPRASTRGLSPNCRLSVGRLPACQRLLTAPVRRGGFATIELVLTLPILAMILLGLFEFSMLFHARSSLVHASRVGARAASLVGVNPQQIEFEVRKVLSPKLQQGLEVQTTPALRTGDAVVVGVSIPMLAASPDLLWPIGYSLKGRMLYAETCMIRE